MRQCRCSRGGCCDSFRPQTSLDCADNWNRSRRIRMAWIESPMTAPRRRYWSFGLRTLFVTTAVLSAGLAWIALQYRLVVMRLDVIAELEAVQRKQGPSHIVRTWRRDPVCESSPWWYGWLGDPHLNHLTVPYPENDRRSARIRELFPDAIVEGISVTPAGQSTPLYRP
jgi:hypothetical protein